MCIPNLFLDQRMSLKTNLSQICRNIVKDQLKINSVIV